MATYSIELREMVNTFGEEEAKSWFMDYELSDYLTEEEIQTIENRGTWNKEKLAQKIIDHYFMREIGFETPAEFIRKAKIAMQEIMEEKLPLIYSSSIEYDPLVNVNFTETYSSNSTGESNSSSNGLTINSDTPQGNISKTDIMEGKYASSTSGTDMDDQTNTSGTENYSKTIKGNSGVSATAQAMVKQYRQNIIMIDRDIINDLATLFMGCYN